MIARFTYVTVEFADCVTITRSFVGGDATV